MREYETVTEVLADAALQVVVPLAMGSSVGRGVEDRLLTADEVRLVTAVDTRSVEKRSDSLRVDATVGLTIHLPHPFDGDVTAAVRTLLEDHGPVATVERVTVNDSYPIESY